MVTGGKEARMARTDKGAPEKPQGGVVRSETKAQVPLSLQPFTPCCVRLLVFVFTVVGFTPLFMNM